MNIQVPVVLIVGASSGIARELITQSLTRQLDCHVIAVSQAERPDELKHERLRWETCDYSEEAVATVVATLHAHRGFIQRVFICNGVLHDALVQPEKRLGDIDSASLHHVMAINAFLPMLWLQQLRPLITNRQSCKITLFSARIGSIADNRRGGWYAYRASKAALNMLVKTAAIEYRRLARGVSFLLFHPGTTDTPLSEPFQQSVAPARLFSPAFVAGRLLSTIDELDPDSGLQYLDWDGQPIPW